MIGRAEAATHTRVKAVPATAAAAAASAAAAAALVATPPGGGGGTTSPTHARAKAAVAAAAAGGGAGVPPPPAPGSGATAHAGEAIGHRRSHSGGAASADAAAVARVAIGGGGGGSSALGVAGGRRVPAFTNVHENPHFPTGGRGGVDGAHSTVIYSSKGAGARRSEKGAGAMPTGSSVHGRLSGGGGAAQPPHWTKHGGGDDSGGRARVSGANAKVLSDQVLKRISPAHSLSRSPSPDRGRRSGSDWATVWATPAPPTPVPMLVAAPHMGGVVGGRGSATRAGLAARSQSLDEGSVSVPPPALPKSGARVARASAIARGVLTLHAQRP